MKKILITLPIVIFTMGILCGVIFNFDVSGTEQTIDISLKSILLNNIKAFFFNVAGAISFGITTSINIFMTGFMLGFTINKAIESGTEIIFILKYTLPHFTEYIAIFISGYLGFSGIELLFTEKFTKVYFLKKLKLFLISIPMIVFAAYMESKIATI